MIKRLDLMWLAGVRRCRYEIYCVTPSDASPLDEFYVGTFKQRQETQIKRNLECERILPLIHMGVNKQ